MALQLTDVEKIRRLPWLLAADTLNTMFFSITLTGSVFLLFLDELGLNEGQIGFLLSLIPFCGIVAPFVAPTVAHFGYKRIFVTFWGIRKTDELFTLLRQTQPETLRGEIGLALARIAGDERYYMQQWRSLHANPSTAAAQAVLALQKQAKQMGCGSLTSLAGVCAENFAQGDLPGGTSLLKDMIYQLLKVDMDHTLACILYECASSLAEFGSKRPEFILLSLHTLNIALHPLNSTRLNYPN